MIKDHPNDEAIQQYVVDIDACPGYIKEHVSNCKDCQIRTRQYMVIIQLLQGQEKPVFDFDLAALVKKKMPQPKRNVSAITLWVIIAALVSIYPLAKTLSFLKSRFFIISGIEPLGAGLIATTAIGLFVCLLVDMNRTYRKKIKALQA